jgi:hypothetical protein
MATTARMPRPRSAMPTTRGREMPPVSASSCGALAVALAVGLADALADGLMEALAEDVASPPPDTLTLAVI